MNKKILLFLVLCIGVFMPKEVFARVDDYYNSLIDIDYRIVDNQNRTDLRYELSDVSRNINMVSIYDSNSNSYIFIDQRQANERLNLFTNLFPTLINQFNTLESKVKFAKNDYLEIITDNRILNNLKCEDGPGTWGSTIDPNTGGYTNYSDTYNYCSSSGFIPLLLKVYKNNTLLDTKIIFGSIHNGLRVNYNYEGPDKALYYEYFSFSLVNNGVGEHPYDFNDSRWPGYGNPLHSNNNPENIEFMKNTIYDYSDGLWEALNGANITSSEINNFVEEYFANNTEKKVYSKYKSNINYKFKVKNGNGMKFKLHDLSNTFSFNSRYDKSSNSYSIVDNSSDSDYQEGIKNFSEIIINEIKNNNFNGLDSKYNSITSTDCNENSCHIYTYIPLILEGENGTKYAKQIVLGLLDINYHKDGANDYYDVSLNLYNNTCELLNSNIEASMSDLINLSRAIEKDYSSSLMNQYSNGSIALDDIYKDVDVNNYKDKYCNDVPIITLRQNPKTFTNGILLLIVSLIVVIGTLFIITKKKNVKV